MNTYKPCEFAKKLNVSVKTLQRWDNAGILKARRSPTGRRYYTEAQYFEYMGQPIKQENRSVIIYARVSSSKQKDDLKNQVTFLREYANAKGIIVDEVLTDIGSGLDFKRKKWNELLMRAQNKEVSQILVAHKDRFIRFGFEWYQQWLGQYGVEIEVVNNEELSPEKEIVEDLISVIHVFSCRIYGLRKYEGKIKKDEELC